LLYYGDSVIIEAEN